MIKPRARIVHAERGRIPISAVVDPLHRAPFSTLTSASRENSHLRDDGFTAHAFRLQGRLSAARFQTWLDHGLPANIFRGKGIIRFENGNAFVFQLCGGRAAFDPYPDELFDSRLVFIGREMDEAALRCDVEACLVDNGRVESSDDDAACNSPPRV